MSDKKFKIMCASIVTVFAIVIIAILLMNRQYANVYYRTYTKENGWSRWVKNGKTSGNGKDNILNIEVKVKSNLKGTVTYSVYQGGKWTKDIGNIQSGKFKNKTIYGLRVCLTGILNKQYHIYYRTYNSADKWLNWGTDADSSGNRDVAIKKVQMKILYDNSSLEDNLDDYDQKYDVSVNLKEVGE